MRFVSRVLVSLMGAAAVVVAHAAPGSKMEALCRELLAAGKPLYTFDHSANTVIIQDGTRIITPKTDWNCIFT